MKEEALTKYERLEKELEVSRKNSELINKVHEDAKAYQVVLKEKM